MYDSSCRLSPCHICSLGLPKWTPRVSKPASSLGTGCGEKGVRDVFVYSHLSLGPGVPSITLWETLAWPLASAQPWPSVTPSPHELCSRQTVPDFQETRPRNYILSASASAVSAPTPPPPWPPPLLPRHSKRGPQGKAGLVPRGSIGLPIPCPVTMWLALLLSSQC